MTSKILIAGFGGQGILFSGKALAFTGLKVGKEVSWLPSYGPEMRGGTANCSVIISDNPVGSPIVTYPDVLIAMNLPSLDKYESEAVPGSVIIVDSTLIDRKLTRTDVKAFYIPATRLAKEMNAPTLANMSMIGKMIKESNAVSIDNLEDAMKKVVPAKKADLMGINMQAVMLGYNYND